MGGSESRFIMGPMTSSGFTSPQLYMHAQNGHKLGSKIILGKENRKDRYQKFKVQPSTHGTYIRFDNHPQPGIRTKKKDRHSVELYNTSWDKHGEWGIIALGIQDETGGKRFVPTKQGLRWDAKQMKKTKRIRVMIYNKASKEYLRTKKTGKEIEVCTGPFEPSHVKSRDDIKNYVLENGFVWEMVYVTSQWTKEEVASSVLLPVKLVSAVVAGIGTVTGAFPLELVALILDTGVSAVETIMDKMDSTEASSVIGQFVEAALKNAEITFSVTGEAAFGKEVGKATLLAMLISMSLGMLDLKIDTKSLLQKANNLQGKKRKSEALTERPGKRSKTEE